MGNHEEDFFLIREILERNRSWLGAGLEHARSLEEAKEMMRERAYGLVLFQHETQDLEAVRLVARVPGMLACLFLSPKREWFLASV